MTHPTKLPVETFAFRDEEFRVSSDTIKAVIDWTCVAVAIRDDVVAVRNVNDRDKRTVVFTPKEWEVFLAAVKRGEFDL
jgi:chemotaxis receptor (MCP) glutamine deamidase CheD